MVGLSAAERRFLEGGIIQGLRSDGRGRHDYRPFSIELGVVPQANGSSRVRLGATDVIVGVKAELGRPTSNRSNQGKVEINVECSPTAAPEFGGRGGEDLSLELSRALQRSLLGGQSGAGAAVDLTALCIFDAKLCWVLYIDGLVLSSEGNLLDALAIAVKAALSNTGIPKVEVTSATNEEEADFEVSDNPEEFCKLDTSKVPVIVTLTKVGKYYIVDATAEEEAHMNSAVSIAVNSLGNISGITKRGGEGLDTSVLLDMISVSKEVGKYLTANIDAEIIAAESRAFDGS